MTLYLLVKLSWPEPEAWFASALLAISLDSVIIAFNQGSARNKLFTITILCRFAGSLHTGSYYLQHRESRFLSCRAFQIKQSCENLMKLVWDQKDCAINYDSPPKCRLNLQNAYGEDFNKSILLRGLLRRFPLMIAVECRTSGSRKHDTEVLECCSRRKDVLFLTHDFATMSDFAYNHDFGLSMPGVIALSQNFEKCLKWRINYV